MESITSNQGTQIVRFTEDAVRKAPVEETVEEVLADLSAILDKNAVQKQVIEKGDELKAEVRIAIIPVIRQTLTQFLANRMELHGVAKSMILIKAAGPSNPYFDETIEYWFDIWSGQMGLKNPNFIGIATFDAHPGFRPYIMPRHELLTPQFGYDKCNERFGGSCWKCCDGSLDEVVVKNDRDPRSGAYVVWFRDQVEADEELSNLSANKLEEYKIPGITLFEREVMEYEYFHRTSSFLDRVNMTLCSGSRFGNGDVPLVSRFFGKMRVRRCDSCSSRDLLRSRQQFSF